MTQHVRGQFFAVALILGAGVALSAVNAAVFSATAQELEWVTTPGVSRGEAIATDPRGNSYVTGQFGGDVFVAKYAPDGTLLWATSAGGIIEDVGLGISADPRGNSYVTGRFGRTATFGAGEPNETVLTGSSSLNFFVAKYASGGTLLWARGVEAIDGVGNGISADQRGNSYITGSFRETATFGAGEPHETVLEGAGDTDIYIAKYAADGMLLWATSAGGLGTDEGLSIATDRHGNSYVTGLFGLREGHGECGPAKFGARGPDETTLECEGAGDPFLAKYSRGGLLDWAVRVGAGSGQFGFGVATDQRGNSYVTGSLGTALIVKYAADVPLIGRFRAETLWRRGCGWQLTTKATAMSPAASERASLQNMIETAHSSRPHRPPETAQLLALRQTGVVLFT